MSCGTPAHEKWLRTEITPILPIAGQKFRRYFEVRLIFLAVYNNFYLFIYSTTSRGTSKGVLLIGKL